MQVLHDAKRGSHAEPVLGSGRSGAAKGPDDFIPIKYRADTALDFSSSKIVFMHFSSNISRFFSNTSDLLASPVRLNGCVSQPARPAMPQGGTLSPAELRRIVADMVG